MNTNDGTGARSPPVTTAFLCQINENNKYEMKGIYYAYIVHQ